MGLFDRNPNESFFVHGKKHWCDVIKNSGDGEMLIWRQPEEDFNTNSTLIVLPGEQAIFVKGGNIEQVFDSGTYQLSTDNYPFISRIRNAFTGGISTFNCVVYFVRKADSKEIKWGTDSPIQVRDKVYNIRTDVRARGAYRVTIDNPSLFLERFIGNNIPFTTQAELDNYFINQHRSKVKTAVSKFLNSLNQELIGLDSYLDDLSKDIAPFIDETLEEYGIKCTNFSIAGLDVDTSKYDQLDQSQIAQIAKTRSAKGDVEVMDILGDKWSKQKSYEVLHDLANNENGNNAGIGLGMGLGTAGAFAEMTKEVIGSNNKQTSNSVLDKMTALKQMLDAGLITQEEYNKKKTELLSQM